MIVLGVRCSNTDITYAVLTGTRAAPEVLESETLAFPKGYQKPQRLKWVVQEAHGIIQKYSVSVVVAKKYEGRQKGNDYEDRVEAEAAVAVAAADNGIKAFYKKQKNTIAKDLGLKGKAKYVDTKLDTTVISEFEGYSPKIKDAVLAAWSAL